MRVRQWVGLEAAVQNLNEIILQSQECKQMQFEDIERKFRAYLKWVDDAQTTLRRVFSDNDLESALLGRGYWHICGAELRVHPWGRLINEELVAQVGNVGMEPPEGHIGSALVHLRLLGRLAQGGGPIYVTDTNALLHYTRFDQLEWRQRTGAECVRLVIPLVVVDELDAKKYARRVEFRSRAREILTVMDRLLDLAPGESAQIQPGVTFEVLSDEAGHVRAPAVDQEILERCAFLAQVTGQPVHLITGDSGMRLNAKSQGLTVLRLGAADLLPRYTEELDVDTTSPA
jgi:hypothetical protein